MVRLDPLAAGGNNRPLGPAKELRLALWARGAARQGREGRIPEYVSDKQRSPAGMHRPSNAVRLSHGVIRCSRRARSFGKTVSMHEAIFIRYASADRERAQLLSARSIAGVAVGGPHDSPGKETRGLRMRGPAKCVVCCGRALHRPRW